MGMNTPYDVADCCRFDFVYLLFCFNGYFKHIACVCVFGCVLDKFYPIKSFFAQNSTDLF